MTTPTNSLTFNCLPCRLTFQDLQSLLDHFDTTHRHNHPTTPKGPPTTKKGSTQGIYQATHRQ